MKLNLEVKNEAQKLIKEYLENNASETLADKINNGVKITKDNKTLINKKDLDGFMQFANKQAQEQAEKGARYACVSKEIVYGWAVHYFEEDSIEGTLYNEDGSNYHEQTKTTPKPVVKPVEIKKPENPQINLFDMFDKKPEPVVTKPTSPIVELDPSIDDIWGDDGFNQVMTSISNLSVKKQPEKPKDDYYEILNQILDNKLEAAL